MNSNPSREAVKHHECLGCDRAIRIGDLYNDMGANPETGTGRGRQHHSHSKPWRQSTGTDLCRHFRKLKRPNLADYTQAYEAVFTPRDVVWFIHRTTGNSVRRKKQIVRSLYRLCRILTDVVMANIGNDDFLDEVNDVLTDWDTRVNGHL